MQEQTLRERANQLRFKLIVNEGYGKRTVENADIDKLASEIIDLARSGYIYHLDLDGDILGNVWNRFVEWLEKKNPKVVEIEFIDADDYGVSYSPEELGETECGEEDYECWRKLIEHEIDENYSEAKANAGEIEIDDSKNEVYIPVLVTGDTPDWYTIGVASIRVEVIE